MKSKEVKMKSKDMKRALDQLESIFEDAISNMNAHDWRKQQLYAELIRAKEILFNVKYSVKITE